MEALKGRQVGLRLLLITWRWGVGVGVVCVCVWWWWVGGGGGLPDEGWQAGLDSPHHHFTARNAAHRA